MLSLIAKQSKKTLLEFVLNLFWPKTIIIKQCPIKPINTTIKVANMLNFLDNWKISKLNIFMIIKKTNFNLIYSNISLVKLDDNNLRD